MKFINTYGTKKQEQHSFNQVEMLYEVPIW